MYKYGTRHIQKWIAFKYIIIYTVAKEKGFMGRKKKEEDNYSILAGKQYSKSNALINAKSKSSLLVQKLFAIGIQQAVEDEKTGILSATLRGTDLRKIFGSKNGSFYDEIKKAVTQSKDKSSIMDYRVIYTNDVTKTVEAINIVTDCKFSDGIFYIRFNDRVNNQIKNLKSNYTIFSLSETMPLKSVYSFRLYEILKSEYDKQEWQAKKNNTYSVNDTRILEIDLIDLKLRLGIIDPGIDPEIQLALQKSEPNYTKIEEFAKNQPDYKSYQTFSVFRKKVLDKAQQELNEKTSISFEYEQLKNGRGGKTTGIRFFIHCNIAEPQEIEKIVEEKTSLSEIEVYTAIFQVQTMLGTSEFSMEDVSAICKAANYNVEKVKQAYTILTKSKAQVDNPTGWLIEAVRSGYKTSKSQKAQNSFNNFPQNKIDYDAIEAQLLDN